MIDKWLKAGILEAVTRRLRAMGIRDKPIAPRHRGGTALPRGWVRSVASASNGFIVGRMLENCISRGSAVEFWCPMPLNRVKNVCMGVLPKHQRP
jgi:hypothetical protein